MSATRQQDVKEAVRKARAAIVEASAQIEQAVEWQRAEAEEVDGPVSGEATAQLEQLEAMMDDVIETGARVEGWLNQDYWEAEIQDDPSIQHPWAKCGDCGSFNHKSGECAR